MSWSIDFIMYLPFYNGNNAIFTCFGTVTKHCRLITYSVGKGALNASLVAKLFFENVLGSFGVSAEVI